MCNFNIEITSTWTNEPIRLIKILYKQIIILYNKYVNRYINE